MDKIFQQNIHHRIFQTVYYQVISNSSLEEQKWKKKKITIFSQLHLRLTPGSYRRNHGFIM